MVAKTKIKFSYRMSHDAALLVFRWSDIINHPSSVDWLVVDSNQRIKWRHCRRPCLSLLRSSWKSSWRSSWMTFSRTFWTSRWTNQWWSFCWTYCRCCLLVFVCKKKEREKVKYCKIDRIYIFWLPQKK